MESEHFYPSHSADKRIRLYDRDCDLNLDSALNELGMLSTITSSRIDYLKEKELDFVKKKVIKKSSSNSLSAAPLCVVHMNSDFVTQFSLSKNSAASTTTECSLSDESLKTNLVVKRKSMCKDKRNFPYCVRKRNTIGKHQKDVCHRRNHLEKYQNDCCEYRSEVLAAEERASPPIIITRQDSGNKSNPSSPVKSQNSLTSLGCSIFRSRSLEDLEIRRLSLNESCELATSHGEIDTVSQRISKLHVS